MRRIFGSGDKDQAGSWPMAVNCRMLLLRQCESSPGTKKNDDILESITSHMTDTINNGLNDIELLNI